MGWAGNQESPGSLCRTDDLRLLNSSWITIAMAFCPVLGPTNVQDKLLSSRIMESNSKKADFLIM